MQISQYEFIGLFASVFVLFSMTVKSDSPKTNIVMRTLNAIGSLLFVIYGFILPAYSTGIMNLCAFFVHIFYIIKLYRYIKGGNS